MATGSPRPLHMPGADGLRRPGADSRARRSRRVRLSVGSTRAAGEWWLSRPHLGTEVAHYLAFGDLQVEAFERVNAAVALGQALGSNGHRSHRRDLLASDP